MYQQIERLNGAQRVRRRPAVIFGSDGTEGVTAMLEMLLGIIASECRHGYASQLTFTLYENGSMEIRDNGRGLYLGSGAPEEDHIWKNKLCEILCGYAYPDEIDRRYEYSYFEPTGEKICHQFESETYSDFDLCAVQYASEFMDVTVHRDGSEFSLHFEKGENVGGLSVRPSDAPSGTRILFKPDTGVFTCVAMPETYIEEQLHALALLTPTCKFIYRRELSQGFEEQIFEFPEGMAGYLKDHCANTTATPVYTRSIAATGKDRYNRPQYGAKIALSLCFSKDNGQQKFFHNRKALPLGGTHIETIFSEIITRFEWVLDCDLSPDLLERHLCLMVHTTTTPYASDWENGTRRSIRNTMIAHMAQDCVKDDFSYYLKTHQQEIMDILQIKP